MSSNTVYSTAPNNASWFRKLGSGDDAKELTSYKLARAAVEKMREAEAAAVADDGKISLPELEAIRTAGQVNGEAALAAHKATRQSDGFTFGSFKDWLGGLVNRAVSGSNETLISAAIHNELRNMSVRDAFEPAARAKLVAIEDISPSTVVTSTGIGDAKFDGAILGAKGSISTGDTHPTAIAPVRPSNGKLRSTDAFIHVNGINTSKDSQVATLQRVADQVGGEVIGVHNATEGISDIVQCIEDKLAPMTNRAVHTLSSTTFKLLKEGKTPHLMAHSQGGIITRRALMELHHRIADDLRPRYSDPVALHAAVQKEMSKVKVETFGGAAHEYPDGPQYVHYVNTWDLVPSELGLGWGATENESAWMINPGKGAKTLYLRNGAVDSEWHIKGVDMKFLKKIANRLNGSATHDFDTIYLPARLDFEVARELNRPSVD